MSNQHVRTSPSVRSAPSARLELVDLFIQFSIDFTTAFDSAMGTEFASNMEMRIVAALHSDAPLTGKQLTERAGTSRRAVASVIKRLEGAGLVSTAVDPDDGRGVQVDLTRAGRTRTRRLSRTLEQFFIAAQPTADTIVSLVPGDNEAPDTELLSPISVAELMASTGGEIEAAIVERAPGWSPMGRQRLALLRIYTAGETRAGELAQYLALSSGGLTYVVDRLVERGLVSRTYGSEEDRRGVILRVTPEGERTADAVTAGIAEAHQVLRACFLQIAARR